MKPAWIRPIKMPLLYRCVLCIAYFYAKIFLKLKVVVKGNIPEGAALIAANHTSYLDPVIVSVSFPEEIHFLAKKSLFSNPLFGSFIRNLNAHPISGDGKDMAVFRAVTEILNNGQKVLLFPEGKRSFDGELEPLKQGVALMSVRNHVPIIPCWIEGSLKAWPRHKKLPHLFGKVTCIFGEPLMIPEMEDTKEQLKILTEKLTVEMLNLRPR
jgi:1-acyl-sn-glycerol-3-phosphate acyltransferase